MNDQLSLQADSSKDASPQRPKRRQMLCTRMLNNDYIKHIVRINRLCVEPVLRTVLDRESTSHAITCLGRRTSSSVYPVDLLVVALDSVELEPRHAAHLVWSRASILRCCALDNVRESLDVSVVGAVSAQVEHGDLLVGEVVVTREALVGLRTLGDGVVECEGGDVGHDALVEAGRVACGVEEGGNGADGYGCCFG